MILLYNIQYTLKPQRAQNLQAMEIRSPQPGQARVTCGPVGGGGKGGDEESVVVRGKEGKALVVVVAAAGWGKEVVAVRGEWAEATAIFTPHTPAHLAPPPPPLPHSSPLSRGGVARVEGGEAGGGEWE
jgi:hypothetical protein